jgi:hypothetical protein
MSYRQKYLKYKKKYIDLKNQLGAAAADEDAEAIKIAFEVLISKLISKLNNDEDEIHPKDFIEQFQQYCKKLNNTTKSSLKQSIVGLLFYRKSVNKDTTFKLDEDIKKKYGIILGQEIKEGYLTDGDYLAINEEIRKEDNWEYDVNLVELTKKGRDKFLEEYKKYYPEKLNEIIGDKTLLECINEIEIEIEKKKEVVQPEGLPDDELAFEGFLYRHGSDWDDKD